ncbi:MAG: VacJ family lipoprotein [Steroidobacteraceae bacterium]|nr:VacJ family lipoprotein [Steroidobacteraceae bacterium]MDW8258012.1 VacJ family lipoprotein [Gammaproteobacteria bacterium]
MTTRGSRRGSLALLVLACAGCATLPPQTRPDPRDPWERLNRTTFAVNRSLDRAIARPIARAYVRTVPSPVRLSVSNFFANALYPTVLCSNLLQGKGRDALSDTARLLLNSTVGVGGLFDVATVVGLKRHDEDFGQVLGKWGVPAGPYLMIPILGPSSVRDTAGQLPDEFTNGLNYIEDDAWRYGLQAFRLLDDRAATLAAESVLARSADEYVLIRSAWWQRREYQVRDGNVADVTGEDVIDEAEPPAETP